MLLVTYIAIIVSCLALVLLAHHMETATPKRRRNRRK